MSLPPRTLDTMSDAIAIASPNGRMSKRAKEAAEKRLSEALFGPGGLTREKLMGEVTPEQKRTGRIAQLERTLSDFRNFYPKQLSSPRDNAVKREYEKLRAELEEINNA